MSIDELLQQQSLLWRDGKRLLIEELVPAENRSISNDELLTLICHEAKLRREVQDTPTLAEYQHRFPHIATELATQWAIDDWLQTDSSLASRLTPINHLLDDRSVQPDFSPEKQHGFIGRYEILDEIGRGSSGIVYEAFDANLNRSVAVKCLRSDFHCDSSQYHRFRLEAETVGRLKHPHIAQVYDSGRDNDVGFIVMEYCERGTLADLVGEPFPTDRALKIILQITSAVAATHAQGIVHRDLKPANVLLSEDGSGGIICKVADFGMAKWLDANDSTTMTGMLLGSPAYMSPEQASGEATEITYRTDVYAIGAILFQLLTGRPPFLGSSIAETLHQVCNTEPLEVRQLNPQAPRALETIVAKCLSKNPGHRYQSAQNLLDEFTRFQEGRPILAKPEGVLQRIRRLASRNPQAATLIGIVLGLLLSITVGTGWFSLSLSQALERTQAAEREARNEQALGLLGKASGYRRGGLSGRRLIAQSILREGIAIGKELQQPANWYAPFRDETIETTWLSDLAVTEWRKFPAPLTYAVFSPSGQRLATLSSEGWLEIRDWKAHQVVASEQLEAPTRIVFLDETRVIVSLQDGIKCFQHKNNKLVLLWSFELEGSSYIVLGRFANVIAASIATQVYFLAADDGKLLSETTIVSDDCHITFSPGNRTYLVTSYMMRANELRSVDDHQVLWSDLSGPGITGTAWFPDGSHFILFPGDGLKAKLYSTSMSTDRKPKFIKELSNGIGGGAVIDWMQDDQLLGLDWGGNLTLFDSHTEKSFKLPFAISLKKLCGDELSALSPGLFGLTSGTTLTATIAQPPQDQVLELGVVKYSTGVEQRQLMATTEHFHHASAYSKLGVTVLHDLSFVDHRSGHLLTLPKPIGLNFSNIAIDDNNRIHAVDPNYSIRFDMQIEADELVLSNARRSPIRAGFPELTISPDGQTFIGGYWSGYSDLFYCGVWVKTSQEPMARRIMGFSSGKYNAITADAKQSLVYFDGAIYKNDLTTGRREWLVASTAISNVSFDSSGSFAIAGEKLWNTENWQEIVFENPELRGSHPVYFSVDGPYAIYHSRDAKSQFVDLTNGDVYLALEGNVIQYVSSTGRLLMLMPDGRLLFRNLKLASEQLPNMGLSWDGPEHVELARDMPLKGVRFSAELQNLKTHDQWMDYLDAQSIRDADLDPHNGDAAFLAALSYLEQARYEEALSELDRCAGLMPKAATPYQWKAYVLAAQRRWQEAIEAATTYVDRTNDIDMRILRAAWFLETEQPEQALADAEAVTKENYLALERVEIIRILAYQQLGDAENESRVRMRFENPLPNPLSMAEAAWSMVLDDISLRNPLLASFYGDYLRKTDRIESQSLLMWIKLRSGEPQAAVDLANAHLNSRDSEIDSCFSELLLAIAHGQLGNQAEGKEHLIAAEQLFAAYKDSSDSMWGSYLRSIRILLAEARMHLNQ